jgi:hypothetical protein
MLTLDWRSAEAIMLTLDGRSAEALLTLGRLVKRTRKLEEINCKKPCKGRSHVRCLFNQYSRGTDDSLTDVESLQTEAQ